MPLAAQAETIAASLAEPQLAGFGRERLQQMGAATAARLRDMEAARQQLAFAPRYARPRLAGAARGKAARVRSAGGDAGSGSGGGDSDACDGSFITDSHSGGPPELQALECKAVELAEEAVEHTAAVSLSRSMRGSSNSGSGSGDSEAKQSATSSISPAVYRSQGRQGAVERTSGEMAAARRTGVRSAGAPLSAARSAVDARPAAPTTDADKRRCCMEALVLWTLEEPSQRTAAQLSQAATLRDAPAALTLSAALAAGKTEARASGDSSAAAAAAAALGLTQSVVAVIRTSGRRPLQAAREPPAISTRATLTLRQRQRHLPWQRRRRSRWPAYCAPSQPCLLAWRPPPGSAPALSCVRCLCAARHRAVALAAALHRPRHAAALTPSAASQASRRQHWQPLETGMAVTVG